MQMLKKLFTKYFLEVVPSIVATVVGAYIVTHYINTKPEADKPKPAVAAPAETAKDVGKGAGRKAVKAEPEKPAAAPEKPAPEKAEKQDAVGERRHQPAAKAAAKPVAPSAEASAQPDERRDANDLARAAIERLRATEPRPAESRAPEAARAPEPAKPVDASAERGKVNNAVYAPATPSAPPLAQPPSVTVMPPPVDAAVAQAKSDDPSRPTPPAEIPSRPLDLRARGHDGGSVAEEVVSAAKSMLQAVVPR
jgi:hypothetical protein